MLCKCSLLVKYIPRRHSRPSVLQIWHRVIGWNDRGTYFCKWVCGHSRQPACPWLADRWYFSSLAARSCRHSWTARWSRLCEETQEEQTCQEEQLPWRWIHCWEPLMLFRTITIHRIYSVFWTVVSTTTTSLYHSVLLSVVIVCVFSFGLWSRCQVRSSASGASD